MAVESPGTSNDLANREFLQQRHNAWNRFQDRPSVWRIPESSKADNGVARPARVRVHQATLSSREQDLGHKSRAIEIFARLEHGQILSNEHCVEAGHEVRILEQERGWRDPTQGESIAPSGSRSAYPTERRQRPHSEYRPARVSLVPKEPLG